MTKWFADKLITFSRETRHLRYFSGSYNSQICALEMMTGDSWDGWTFIGENVFSQKKKDPRNSAKGILQL